MGSTMSRKSQVSKAIRQLYTASTRFYFVNQEGDPLPDLYMTVATLPGVDGIGVLKSVDEEASTVDICYRVKPDGRIIGWVSLDGENEHSILPILPEYDVRGDMESLKVQFSGGYVAEYRTCTFEDHYYPSEEVAANEQFMTAVDY